MLSRGKVTPTTVAYYSGEVASGVEDYYAGRGEAAGYWMGAGADVEGLEGAVSAEELARLFEARHPRSGEPLGAAYRVRDGAVAVTGWDLTFSAPKSVSVLWAVGGGEVGMAVRDAHDAAVATALAYLEEHAAFSRTGKAGVRQVDTEGLVAAGFVHRTSRAGDPQLHTHVLVSGRVRCGDDGVWRALDSRALHAQLKPAGMVYQAALRAELTARLGVAWTAVDRHGQAEIAGVPAGLRRLFSKRRTVVEDAAAERVAALEAELGRALTAAERRRVTQVAVLDTRTAKTHGAEIGLHDRWRDEAAVAGHDPAAWIDTAIAGRSRTTEIDRGEGGGEAAGETTSAVAVEIVAELAAERSTWRRVDAVRAAARRVPVTIGTAEAARRWVETAADAALRVAGVVELAAPEAVAPAGLQRRDGRSVFDRHDAARYTTLATLATEQHVLDAADAGRHAGRAIADHDAVDAVIADAGVGVDQEAVVRAITTRGHSLDVVVGPAGAGKSRAMRAAAHAWAASGIAVRGLALSAVAAGVLSHEAAIPADTIAKFLAEHDRPDGPRPEWRLHRGEVVIVDEAGMVASRDLARLTALTREAGAKLVLVGDWAQLGAVEAGGLFRLLAADHAVELGTPRRFTHPWEAEASLRLRAGDPTVVDTYLTHDRLIGADHDAVAEEAAARRRAARAAGESLVIAASDHATVSAICDTVRRQRVAVGEVEPGGLLTDAGQTVGVGDEVVTLRNQRTLTTSRGGWVRNGDRWTVTSRHPDRSLAVSSVAGHGTVLLPADYAAEHVALAYALTVHKAQGVTVDHSLLVVDETTAAEALYVGMTRGRHTNTALVCTDPADADDRHTAPERVAARDVFAAALGRAAADECALHALRTTLERSESLAVLAPRLAAVEAQLRRDTPDNPAAELVRLTTRRHYLQRRPASALTRAGRDTRRTLADLDTRIAALEAQHAARERWLADHADLFAYRDDLARKVAARRAALGIAAVVAQPDHLTAILGPLPENPKARDRWTHLAGRVEAYREEWNLAPDRLTAPPVDAVQQRAWDASIRTALTDPRPRPERGREAARGIGMEL